MNNKTGTNPALLTPPKYIMGQMVRVPVEFAHNKLKSIITLEGEIVGIRNRGSHKQGSLLYVYDVFIAMDGEWDTVAVTESEATGE